MKRIARLQARLGAIPRVVINIFTAERPALDSPKIMEVRRNNSHGVWEIVSEGRRILLARSSRTRAIGDAEELAREKGGGEIRVMRRNVPGEVAERVWVLDAHRGISANAPRIVRGNWVQRQEEGWRIFATIPTFGFFTRKPSDRSGRMLIDLLQALMGEDNVTSGFPFEIDGLWEGPRGINIYVRCSDKDLTTLKDSVSWFRLAAFPEWRLEGMYRYRDLRCRPPRPSTYRLPMERLTWEQLMRTLDELSSGKELLRS